MYLFGKQMSSMIAGNQRAGMSFVKIIDMG